MMEQIMENKKLKELRESKEDLCLTREWMNMRVLWR